MASLHLEKRPTGNYFRISFYDQEKRRKFIRLGAVSKKLADAVLVRVRQLVDLNAANLAPDPDLSNWLAKIGQGISDKLAEVGLIGQRQSSTLEKFIREYIESRVEARPNTIRNFHGTRACLVEHFGADTNLRDITVSEAQSWKQTMLAAGSAEATVSKRIKHAKQFFKIAQERGLVTANPFSTLKAGGERNDARLEFIDRKRIDKLIESAPDAEWRLIIALARYGGLRTPSETLALKWSDVNLADGILTVPSPKTERHNKGYRVIPLFPELRPYLEEAKELAKNHAIHVISRYRDNSANLRTQLLRIIRKAGLLAWERCFHNLRASRQIELADNYPAHVVADWLGNSPAVAERHYLKTTEHHFQKALAEPSTAPAIDAERSTTSGTIGSTVALPVALHSPEQSCMEMALVQSHQEDIDEAPQLAAYCTNEPVPPRGIEPRSTA